MVASESLTGRLGTDKVLSWSQERGGEEHKGRQRECDS